MTWSNEGVDFIAVVRFDNRVALAWERGTLDGANFSGACSTSLSRWSGRLCEGR
jgi:hypothetical protein